MRRAAPPFHASLPTCLAACVAACVAACSGAEPERIEPRCGDEISVCGQLFHTGTPVVLWSDPEGYDAYQRIPRFEPPELDEAAEPVRAARYGPRRDLPDDVAARAAEHGLALDDLRRVVRQFVLHYDVCGTSRQCFKILQDKRKLSVHFMLDVDGTIYQTLDLRERAWHAGAANDHSVGVEIAHIGAYPAPGHPVMRSFYEKDPGGDGEGGVVLHLPKWMTVSGVRTEGFVARPARPGLLAGEINGRRYWQHDYTEAQHRALIKLTAALCRVFPAIELRVPRDADGNVLDRALGETELAEFAGILGHWHVTTNKSDPGPALDWDRLLHEARAVPE